MYLWSPLLGRDYWYLGSGDAVSFPTEAERLTRLHKRAGCDCTEEEAMPIDLDEIRKKHIRGTIKRCKCCARAWPCDAIQLADEVEQLRSKYTASQEEMTELLTEHRKLVEALEWIIECDKTTPWYDLLTERHAALPRQIARDALGRPSSEDKDG
jgi:hypothetical protein